MKKENIHIVHVRVINGDVYVSSLSEHPSLKEAKVGKIIDHTLDWQVWSKVTVLDLAKVKDADVYPPEQTGYLVPSFNLFPSIGDGKCRLSPMLMGMVNV